MSELDTLPMAGHATFSSPFLRHVAVVLMAIIITIPIYNAFTDRAEFISYNRFHFAAAGADAIAVSSHGAGSRNDVTVNEGLSEDLELHRSTDRIK